MRSRFLLLVLLATPLFSFDQPSKPSNSNADIGHWRVAELLDRSPSEVDQGGMTEKQARHALGSVVITKNGLRGCPAGRVANEEPSAGLIGINHLPIKNHLGLPPLTVVFEYGNACGGDFWLRADGDLVAGVGGYYFHLRRIVLKKQH